MAAFPSSGEFFMGVIPVLNNLFKCTPTGSLCVGKLILWAGVSSDSNVMIYKVPWDPRWKEQFRPGLSAYRKKHASVNQLLITQLPSVA